MTKPPPKATPEEALGALMSYHDTGSGVQGGDLSVCATALSMDLGQAEKMWDKICADLGEASDLTNC